MSITLSYEAPNRFMPRATPLSRKNFQHVCKNIEKYAIFTEILEGKRFLLIHDKQNSLLINDFSGSTLNHNMTMKIDSKYNFVLDGILKYSTFYVHDEYSSKSPNLFERLKYVEDIIEHSTIEGIEIKINYPIRVLDFIKPRQVPYIFKPIEWIPSETCEGLFKYKEWSFSYGFNFGIMILGDSIMSYVMINEYNMHSVAEVGIDSDYAKDLIDTIKTSEKYDKEIDLKGNIHNLNLVIEFGYNCSCNGFYPRKLLGKCAIPDSKEMYDTTLQAIKDNVSIDEIRKEFNAVHKSRPLARIIPRKFE